MRLEGKSGEDTGHDGTEASGVAASAVENRGRGRGRSRGGAGRNGAGGETDGAQGGAGRRANGGDTGGGDLGAGGGGRSGGLRLRADGGGDLDARVDGGRGRNGSLGLGADGGGLGSLNGHSAGAGTGASSGGDTELGGVLVLAGTLDNEEQTVVGGVGLEVRARSPLELAAVGDGLGESLQRDDVVGGTAQENQGDGTSSRRLPLDGVGLALGHDLVQTRSDDGIATGVLAVVRRSVGSGHGHEGGESGCDGETHYDLVSRLTKNDWGREIKE
jgi:hypothetical protein